MRDMALEPATGGGALSLLGAAGWGVACGVGGWVASLWSSPLLAESGGWRDAFLLLSPAVAAVATWALMEWRKSKAQDRQDRREDEKTQIDYWKELYELKERERADADRERERAAAELDRERRQCRVVVDELTDRLRVSELKAARYEMYAGSLEERLDDKGVPYRPWRDTPAGAPPSPTPPPEARGDSKHRLKPPGDGSSP